VIGDQPARQLEIEIVETHRRTLRPTGDQSAADGWPGAGAGSPG